MEHVLKSDFPAQIQTNQKINRLKLFIDWSNNSNILAGTSDFDVKRRILTFSRQKEKLFSIFKPGERGEVIPLQILVQDVDPHVDQKPRKDRGLRPSAVVPGAAPAPGTQLTIS